MIVLRMAVIKHLMTPKMKRIMPSTKTKKMLYVMSYLNIWHQCSFIFRVLHYKLVTIKIRSGKKKKNGKEEKWGAPERRKLSRENYWSFLVEVGKKEGRLGSHRRSLHFFLRVIICLWKHVQLWFVYSILRIRSLPAIFRK